MKILDWNLKLGVGATLLARFIYESYKRVRG